YDILIEELDTSICLDVGHAILQQEESPLEIMKRWKDKVHEIHFHNVLYSKIRNRIHVYEDHRGLTTGVLDVASFLDHLVETGFSHPVMLEIMTQEEIADSLTYIESLRYKVR
ncbi:MAG: TIM barrel protein, partial [Candidatus Hodarchaeota archaeon]